MRIDGKRVSKAECRAHLGSIIDRELAHAEGADSDELQANRKAALDYYHARPRGDEVSGQSQVISTDVADMVNATLAMLTPMLSTDAVVTYEAENEQDEAAAAAEGRAVNKLIIEDNHGFVEIQEAVKDALLLKNGVMKVWTEDADETITYPVGDAEPAQIAAWISGAGEGTKREHAGDALVETRSRRKFRCGAVPVERISYQAGFCGELQDIRFFAEQIDLTRSDLVKRGIDRATVDELPATYESTTEARTARTGTYRDGLQGETRDQDIIACHEAYILVDLDDDGISERYRVLVADRNRCLEYEQVDLLPYAMGSPYLNPHRITGESQFDHLKATQDVKTMLRRQLLNNVSTINNGRYIYDPSKVNEQDVLTPRAGGGIRSRNASPADAVLPLMVPDVSSGILSALNYEDQCRTERGGASLEMLTADAQIVGETAHGIERQYAAREALVSMIATNLSETMLRDLYILMHEFLRRYSTAPIMVTVAGMYGAVDPRTWPKRTRVNITTGQTPGQRGHLQNVLMQHLQMQAQAIASGGKDMIADLRTMYRTSVDLLRLAGVPNPERLLIDPDSPSAQEAMARAQEAEQAAADAAREEAEFKRRIEIEKIQSDERVKMRELEFKYWESGGEQALREAEIIGRGVIELEKGRINGPDKAREGATAAGNGRNRQAGGS